MSHEWHDNELLTNPQEFAIATTEKTSYSWDLDALLDIGETPGTPSVRIDEMTSKANGVTLTTPNLVTNVFASDTVVVATIDGTLLKQNELYRVIVTVTASPTKQVSCMTMMKCVA
jgi:hypothetical protein